MNNTEVKERLLQRLTSLQETIENQKRELSAFSGIQTPTNEPLFPNALHAIGHDVQRLTAQTAADLQQLTNE